ncbi:lecithin retinol acyltransferase family protein [Pseudoalteromonas shioyasakiensis]|uniref:lecithin retinol acyltransferase family protein n=1 Tax=Pseudoalteromonas shioyasakiensis TaxID=1190813 RepID=UPI001C3CF6F5|nr:lecithin retinol acyltransferase family protein [Pseudoalteromonas shioyasakiensis]
MGFLPDWADTFITNVSREFDANNNIKFSRPVKRGTVLRVEKDELITPCYYHFGIYAGEGKVIHFSRGEVRKDELDVFLEDTGMFNSDIDIMYFDPEYSSKYTLEKSYRRAKSKLGERDYQLLKNNCEHFAVWCRTGKAVSAQAFGSKSNHYGALNLPGIISFFNNELGMDVSRSVSIDDFD